MAEPCWVTFDGHDDCKDRWIRTGEYQCVYDILPDDQPHPQEARDGDE